MHRASSLDAPRIRPGAPTSSIDISATGRVGLGTRSPAAWLQVNASAGNDILNVSTNGEMKALLDESGNFGLGASPANFSGLTFNPVLNVAGTVPAINLVDGVMNFEEPPIELQHWPPQALAAEVF